MATTSSIDLPSTDAVDTTLTTVASVVLAWISYGIALTRWAATRGRAETLVVDRIALGFGAATLTTALIALAVLR